jgi:drug/metabolite transporter (DMT)-like permease
VSAPRSLVIAAFAAIYFLWGGTFLAIRYSVAEVPPLVTIAIRCLGGAVLLFLWLGLRGERSAGTGAQWRTALLAGTLLFLGCHSLLAWAEQRVGSGEAALLLTAIPLWLVLLDAARTRRVPGTRVLVGLGLGVLGVGVLAAGDGARAGDTSDRLWLVASALCWAVGSLVARHGPRPASAVQSTAMQLAAGGAVVLGASVLLGEPAAWEVTNTSARATLSLAFLVVGGTVLGFGAYTWLLQVTTPAAVGTYAFVNPVVALVLAWIVGDGALTARTLLATAIVVSAVVLTGLPTTGAAAARNSPRSPAFRSPRAGGFSAVPRSPKTRAPAGAGEAGA